MGMLNYLIVMVAVDVLLLLLLLLLSKKANPLRPFELNIYSKILSRGVVRVE